MSIGYAGCVKGAFIGSLDNTVLNNGLDQLLSGLSQHTLVAAPFYFPPKTLVGAESRETAQLELEREDKKQRNNELIVDGELESRSIHHLNIAGWSRTSC